MTMCGVVLSRVGSADQLHGGQNRTVKSRGSVYQPVLLPLWTGRSRRLSGKMASAILPQLAGTHSQAHEATSLPVISVIEPTPLKSLQSKHLTNLNNNPTPTSSRHSQSPRLLYTGSLILDDANVGISLDGMGRVRTRVTDATVNKCCCLQASASSHMHLLPHLPRSLAVLFRSRWKRCAEGPHCGSFPSYPFPLFKPV